MCPVCTPTRPTTPSPTDSTPPPPPPSGNSAGPASGSPDGGGEHGNSPTPTLPPTSDLWTVFRESFLFYFDPDKRETLRAAGDVLFTSVLSGDVHRPEEPWTHARLRALVRDLRFSVQLLEEISREPLDSHPEDEDENRLAREVSGCAEEVEAVARQIEEAVDRWGGWGDDEGG